MYSLQQISKYECYFHKIVKTKMLADNPVDLNLVRLSLLTYESQSLLSLLLNTKKVLPSDPPDKLPRDWRGLATLLNISSEIAASINESQDKTARVLDIWIKRNDGSDTIGQLMSYLRRIDRHDISDDLLELASKGQLYGKPTKASSVVIRPPRSSTDTGLITYDDVSCGAPQIYDAFVIYANEDRDFIDELLMRMRAKGYKLCTNDDLLPGHSTQYAPVAKLLSERCHRIILVYSPDFLNSTANTFYMDYAQAVDIESDTLKIMPLMYRQCQLPPQHAYYYKLYYSPPGQKASYNFWDKLSQSLEYTRALSRNSITNGLKITELTTSNVNLACKDNNFLALPEIPRSASFTAITTNNSTAPLLSDNISLSANDKKNKSNPIRKFFSSKLRSLKKGKKVKKAIAVCEN